MTGVIFTARVADPDLPILAGEGAEPILSVLRFATNGAAVKV